MRNRRREEMDEKRKKRRANRRERIEEMRDGKRENRKVKKRRQVKRKLNGWAAKDGFVLGSGLTKILTLIAFIIVITIFYILFALQSPKEFSIYGKSEDISSSLMLNNILRTPVEVRGEYLTVSELIELAHADCSSYCHPLRSIIGEILSLSEYEYELPKCIRTYKVDIYEHTSVDEPLGPYGRGGAVSGYVKGRNYADLEYGGCIDYGGRGPNPNINVQKKVLHLQDGEEIIIELKTITRKR